MRSGNSRFGGGPSWKATGLQLQSGNLRLFGGWPCWKATGLQLQSATSWFFGGRRKQQLLGGRPNWKMTGLQLQSGYSRFSLVAGWPSSTAIENSLSVALSTLLSGQPMYSSCIALLSPEVRWSEMEWHVSFV